MTRQQRDEKDEAPPGAAASVNAFGIDLYQEARKTPGNLVVSPLSIFAALAMTLGGARGRTAAQMKQVLHLEGPTEQAVKDTGQFLASYADGGPGMTLRVANCLFGEKGYAFDPGFLERTADTFGAPLEPVDFKNAPDRARRRINGWVEKQTEDRIKDLLPAGAVDDATRLVLANAIYFLGDWKKPFQVGATRPEAFRGASGQARVPMMHQTDHFRFAEDSGAKILELPYRDGDLAMVLVLPAHVEGLGAIEERLTPAIAEAIAEGLAALTPIRVAVTLPRFQLEPPSLALGDTLSALGMPLAFNGDRADFTGIAVPQDTDGLLFLSSVFHKAFVKVDEKGTEAAAATGAVMSARAISVERKPVEFKADHPFLFFILDRRSGLILFLGRVCDPSSGAQPGTESDAGDPLGRPLRLRRDGDDASAAMTEGDPGAALRALLRQIDQRWPNRRRGTQDGLQAEGSRLALAISEDVTADGRREPYLPPLPVLSAVLDLDPRTESAEILKPSWNSPRDIRYLQIVTRKGLSSEDASPWVMPQAGNYVGALRPRVSCLVAARGRHPPPGTVYPPGDPRAGEPITAGGAQSYNNCGIEASRMVINQLKKTHYTEDEVFDHAIDHGEASGSRDPARRYASGAQSAHERQRLLQDYGIASDLIPQDMDTIAQAVARGRGVILRHDPGVLWDDVRHLGGNHAVNTVGLTYGRDGAIQSVTVLDSAMGDCPTEIPIARYVKSLGFTQIPSVLKSLGFTGAHVPLGTRTTERVWDPA